MSPSDRANPLSPPPQSTWDRTENANNDRYDARLLSDAGIVIEGDMELVDIIDDASDAVKAAIQAAYDAGRAAGRKEAADELKERMSAIFAGISDDPTPLSFLSDANVSDEVSITNGARATPGSVKPKVERMLQDAQNGLTAAEIADRAGFKFNSVRGTLWSLGKEGFAEQRDGRWYAIKRDDGLPSEPEREPAAAE